MNGKKHKDIPQEELFIWDGELERLKKEWSEKKCSERKLITALHEKISEIKNQENTENYEYLKIFVKNRVDSYDIKVPNNNAIINTLMVFVGLALAFAAIFYDSQTFEYKYTIFIIGALIICFPALLYLIYLQSRFIHKNNKGLYFYKICLNVINSLS